MGKVWSSIIGERSEPTLVVGMARFFYNNVYIFFRCTGAVLGYPVFAD